MNSKYSWLLTYMQDKITEGKAVGQSHPKEKCERTHAWTFSQCGHWMCHSDDLLKPLTRRGKLQCWVTRCEIEGSAFFDLH